MTRPRRTRFVFYSINCGEDLVEKLNLVKQGETDWPPWLTWAGVGKICLLWTVELWNWSEIWWEHHYQVTAAHFDTRLSQADSWIPQCSGGSEVAVLCRQMCEARPAVLGLLTAQGGKVLTSSIIITVLFFDWHERKLLMDDGMWRLNIFRFQYFTFRYLLMH